MAATVELAQLAEAVRARVEQQGHLQQLIGSMAQSPAAVMTELAKPKTFKVRERWSAGSKHNNNKVFGGGRNHACAVGLTHQGLADSRHRPPL